MTARQLGIRGLTEHDEDSAPLKAKDTLSKAEPMRLSPIPRREKLERRSQGNLNLVGSFLLLDRYLKLQVIKNNLILDSPPPKHLKSTSSYQKSYPITAIEKSDRFGSVCKTENVQPTKSSRKLY